MDKKKKKKRFCSVTKLESTRTKFFSTKTLYNIL